MVVYQAFIPGIGFLMLGGMERLARHVVVLAQRGPVSRNSHLFYDYLDVAQCAARPGA
jgi:hypothetical protein